MTSTSILHSNPSLLSHKSNYTQVIPVVLSTSTEFLPFLAVTIQSISEHANPNYLYHLHVFHTSDFNLDRALGIQRTLAQNICITFIDVTNYIENLHFSIPSYTAAPVTIETFFRLLVPELITDYDKVIFLDSDVLVLNDLIKLYNLSLGNNLVAGVTEYLPSGMDLYVQTELGIDPETYINAGVLLLDCKGLNAFGFKEKYTSMLSVRVPNILDQDLINLICRNRIYYLDIKWNYRWHIGVSQLMDIEVPYILHYLSIRKPWTLDNRMLSKYFYQYAALTLFNNEIPRVNGK
ncbi:MAG: glycosyltransferase family 8 protein [bacterium]|nr:glycosyltransferase family 8 protein [bacterium]